MRVADRFKCINLRHLEIAASALYLLVPPATSDEACTEALELASQGETITLRLQRFIVPQQVGLLGVGSRSVLLRFLYRDVINQILRNTVQSFAKLSYALKPIQPVSSLLVIGNR